MKTTASQKVPLSRILGQEIAGSDDRPYDPRSLGREGAPGDPEEARMAKPQLDWTNISFIVVAHALAHSLSVHAFHCSHVTYAYHTSPRRTHHLRSSRPGSTATSPGAR